MIENDVLGFYTIIKKSILNLPIERIRGTQEEMYVCTNDDAISAFLKLSSHPILKRDHSQAIYFFSVIVDNSLVPDCIYIVWNNDEQDKGYLLFYIPRFMDTFFNFSYFIELSNLSGNEVCNTIDSQLQDLGKRLNHKFEYKIWKEPDGHTLAFSTEIGVQYLLTEKYAKINKE